MRNNVKARERNGLGAGWKPLQKTVRWESLRRTETGWQPSAVLGETEIMIAMKTAAGRGTGEATQGEGRRLGRNLAFYLPGESFACHSFFLVGLKEIISLSGGPFIWASISWPVTLLRRQYMEQRQSEVLTGWCFVINRTWAVNWIFSFLQLNTTSHSGLWFTIKLFGEDVEEGDPQPGSTLSCSVIWSSFLISETKELGLKMTSKIPVVLWLCFMPYWGRFCERLLGALYLKLWVRFPSTTPLQRHTDTNTHRYTVMDASGLFADNSSVSWPFTYHSRYRKWYLYSHYKGWGAYYLNVPVTHSCPTTGNLSHPLDRSALLAIH